MNIDEAVSELVSLRDDLDTLIKTLSREFHLSTGKPVSRRGRKSMSPEERAIVAERMRRFWAERRAARITAALIADVHPGSAPPN